MSHHPSHVLFLALPVLLAVCSPPDSPSSGPEQEGSLSLSDTVVPVDDPARPLFSVLWPTGPRSGPCRPGGLLPLCRAPLSWKPSSAERRCLFQTIGVIPGDVRQSPVPAVISHGTNIFQNNKGKDEGKK